MTTIDWASLMQQAQAASMAMPVGEYDMVVVDSTSVSSKTGKPMYKTKLQVESGPHQGRTLTNNFTLSVENPIALRIFFRQMQCFGLDANFFSQNPAPEQVAAMMIGRRARITLGIRKWQGEDQNEITQMNPALGTGPSMPASGGVVAQPMAPVVGAQIPAAAIPTPMASFAAQVPVAPAVPTPAPPSPVPAVPQIPAAEAAPAAAMQWVIVDGQPVQVPVTPPTPEPPVPQPTPEPVTPAMVWTIDPATGQPVQVPADGAAAVPQPAPVPPAPVDQTVQQQQVPTPVAGVVAPTAPPPIPY